jgi:hypothetical protein
MAVKVASRLRQALSDTVLGSSLAGDGLLIRLRSTSIAILAVVAVVGLGLVAFISQLGWPSVLSGPIPQGPAGGGVVHNDPIALVRATPQTEASTPNAPPAPDAPEVPAAPLPSVPEPPPPSPVATSPEGGVSPGGPPSSPAIPAPAGKDPQPSPPAAPAPVEPAPPDGEASAPAQAAAVEEESPGRSGEAPGHTPGTGPPPWAGNGGRNASGHEIPGRAGRGED